jgi:hypothetical protein
MRTKKQPTTKERMRKHEEKCRRFMPIEDFRSLTFGMKAEQIAELSGYSLSTVNRWFAEKMPIPFTVQQLFKLRQNKVIGKEWKDWKFGSDGLLYPFRRRGFNGRELAGMWFTIQTNSSLEREVRNLKKSIEKLSDKIDEQEKLIFFYRSQVQAEAKLGMCLMRIMA